MKLKDLFEEQPIANFPASSGKKEIQEDIGIIIAINNMVNSFLKSKNKNPKEAKKVLQDIKKRLTSQNI